MSKVFDEWAEKHLIAMTSVQVFDNPNINSDPKWQVDHWLCTFSHRENTDKRTFKLYYSMGIGLRKKFSWGDKAVKPTVADVLECVQMDINSVVNCMDFEEWATEYGYDADSRKAEATYQIVQKQRRDFKEFLKWEAYNEFLALRGEE